MGFWDFHQTADRHWQWRYVPESAGECVYGGRFRSRNDCIADAMRHGYLSESDIAPIGQKSALKQDVQQDLHEEGGVSPFLQRFLSL